MKKINNKGFVMIETIIVMSILAIALLSLYTSYSLIMKKNNISNNDSSINTYIAYNLANYNFYTSSNTISSTYYVEVLKYEDSYVKRDCGYLFENLKCGILYALSIEEQSMYLNLNIDKIYYINIPFRHLFNNNMILLFDGSTISYLNSIKNSADINLNSGKTIIVKTKEEDKYAFSYYQFEG